ncbi:hypothetical protein QE152_g25803 [Popillia japonica]|uniref:Repressor of the inhibitor of the protein kinase n=1 Tax=Popillia japonica TaxID=7064 RepID=A0AAW1K0H2_POPJA
MPTDDRVLRGDAVVLKTVETVLKSEELLQKIGNIIAEKIDQKINQLIKTYEVKVSQLEDKLEKAIYGLPESVNEDTDASVIKFYKEKMNIEVSKEMIDCSHRLGKEENHTKPLLVKFVSKNIKQEIYKNKRKLKGSELVIKEDLTKKNIQLMKRVRDKYKTQKKTVDVDLTDEIEVEVACATPPELLNLKNVTNENLATKYDIGLYIKHSHITHTDLELYDIFKNIWTPSSSHNFEPQIIGNKKRTFQISWLQRFNWLAYSEVCKGSLCKVCILFLCKSGVGKGSHEQPKTLVSVTFKNWKSALECFEKHSKKIYHKEACIIAENFMRVTEGQQKDVHLLLQKRSNEEVQRNRKVLTTIIETIVFCGRQELALRGHRDSGKLSLTELNYNDGNLRALLRYRIRDKDENGMKLREDYLTFVPVHDLAGAALAGTLKETLVTLVSLGLNLNNLRGQGYDGASAMRGSFRGVQSIIREEYPRAIYTHCASHCLNLCLSDVSKVTCIRNAFGTINEVCTFFRRSAKRSNILFQHAFSCIVLALEDKDDQGNTQALHQAICRFSFIIALKISERMLGLIYKLSQYLQSTFIDLCTALDSIKEILTVVENIRANAESDFRKFFVKAVNIGNEFGVEPTIPRQVGSQRHRDNYPGATPEEYFRTSIFVPFVDDLRASLIERFVTHQTTLASLQTIMPRNIINSNFDSIKPALQFYRNDLNDTNEAILEGEWDLWKLKWKSYKNKNDIPKYAIDALNECNYSLCFGFAVGAS